MEDKPRDFLSLSFLLLFGVKQLLDLSSMLQKDSVTNVVMIKFNISVIWLMYQKWKK